MSILYSIPVHECSDCVKQICDGILFFDNDAIVVVHISKSQQIDFYASDDNRIIINPIQFETCWGWDLSRIHVSNYLYVKNNYNYDISYIIFLTSNSLMLKNPLNFIKQFDAGFSEVRGDTTKLTPPLIIEKYQLGWFGSIKDDSKFLKILNEINSDKLFGCIIDGCYVNTYIMDKICELYEKYYKYETISYTLEERLFPTIACNLSNNISESLMEFRSVNLNEFKTFFKKNNIYFNKRIPREMSHEIRKYYDILIKNGPKYLDFFQKVYYINLDYRTDRRKVFEKNAKKLEIPITRFSGIIPNENEYNLDTNDARRKFKIGCTLSHQAIIREAKEKKLENVLIFEDDCIFLENFKEKAEIYVNELKNIEWDLFYFGGDPTTDCTFITEHLAKIKPNGGGVYCTHAYAINNTFYDRILNTDPNSIQAIDTIFVNQNGRYVNIILGDEILAVQDNTFSDLWGHITNSIEIMKRTWKQHVNKNIKINDKIKKMEHYFFNIEGWFDLSYQELYLNAVKNASDDDYFVEIGVWKGASTSYMGVEILNSNKKIKFDAIDCFGVGTLSEGLYEVTLNNLKDLIDIGIINLVKEYSTIAVNNYKDETITFCFIDASHEYNDIKSDLEAWLPKIMKGGVLSGHDYDMLGHPGVYKAVNEVLGKENIIYKGGSCFYYKKPH